MRELQLKKVISEIISSEINKDFPYELWLLTITWIKVAKDFSFADIFVSVFPKNEWAANYLNSRAWYLQSIVNKKIRRRSVPKIKFIYDDSWELMEKLSYDLH